MITRCAQRNARTGPALWAALASVIGLLAWTGSAYGQDSHYWNQQYGPRASLLSLSLIHISEPTIRH